MRTKKIRMGGIIIGDEKGVVMNSDIAVQAGEEAFGQMVGIPMIIGRAQFLAQLVNDSLGEQGERHLPVANMKVERAGALPSQILIGVEEFFDMPSFGIGFNQELEFITILGGKKSLKLLLLGMFPQTLYDLEQRKIRGVVKVKGAFGGGQSSPSMSEVGGRNVLHSPLIGVVVGDGNNKSKGSAFFDITEEVNGEVFFVGQQDNGGGRRGEHILHKSEKV